MRVAAAPQADAPVPLEAGLLHGLRLRFREEMTGFVALGESDPVAGAALGRASGTRLSFDVSITVADLAAFLRRPDHAATLEGTVTFAPLGGSFAIRDGHLGLFVVGRATGHRRLTYSFAFTASDGRTYAFRGHKDLCGERATDVLAEMTTLHSVLHAGPDERAPAHAAGQLRFLVTDVPALVSSIEVEGATSRWQGAAARIAFASLIWGSLRDTYLRHLRLLYDARTDNLVLSGEARDRGGDTVPFFLVTGVHEPGFPWGDGGAFSDVLLAVGDGSGGWRRYAVSDRALEGLDLDLAAGTCRYRGDAFRLDGGAATSFSAMRGGAAGLVPCELDLAVSFEAHAHDPVNVVLPHAPAPVRALHARLARTLRELLPGTHLPGITITPHAVSALSGTLAVRETGGAWSRLAVVASRTFGEAEHGAFRNVKAPALRYGYLCAVDPGRRAARVQIRGGTLRGRPSRWARDRLEARLDARVARVSASELCLADGTLRISPLAPAGDPADRAAPLRKVGDPVLEVANDHLPTATLVRRIVEVESAAGERCLALEEDVTQLRHEPIGTPRRVKVASLSGNDPLSTLDRVLDATGFDALVEARLAASGKAPGELLVAIKPNFMFAYDRRDRSTYTDPALVHHLVARLRRRGIERVKVVEAQCTYGEYFRGRSVGEVARYLGYDGRAGYEVVDLTLDEADHAHLGPHLGVHPVPRTWRDADLRISFAKSKTHCYAHYTLTLKNVFGALALANKFKEYHCGRGIYGTTIDYLRAFPVHFGLVDAWLGADGPFGIFADTAPNDTRAVIGGADLVAVDWVTASRMGLDPLVSPFMAEAVKVFGKPAIDLVGDAGRWRPWLAVPDVLTAFTNHGLDASHALGNLFYAGCAHMDEAAFPPKDLGPGIAILRRLSAPLRRAFFVVDPERPSAANRFFGRLFVEMGS